ncbi:unnamed protein product [Auanema sp. JU1783]|nr:unnamed protein product [Auanema sp. JU1783]
MGQSRSRITEQEVEQLKQFQDQQIEERIAREELRFLQIRALELSSRRESLLWEVLGAGTLTVLLLVTGSIYKRKDFVVPIAGLIMTAGYRYDTAYGNSYGNIKDSAESLLQKDRERLKMVDSPITLKEIDSFRENRLS